MTKKLKLEIKDPVGNTVRTHHFFYEAGGNNKLILTVDQNTYIMKPDGTLISDAKTQTK